MSKPPHTIIYIKKKSKGQHAPHHGGSWKIAYADFVTAMMAFFMLMWLISITSDEHKKGIADYFATGIINMNIRNGSRGMMAGTQVSPDNNSEREKSDPANTEQHQSVPEKEDKKTDAEVEQVAKSGEKAEQNKASVSDNKINLLESKKEKDAKSQDSSKGKNESKSKAEREKNRGEEEKQFQETSQEIKNIIQQNPLLKDLTNQVTFELRSEGLLIQIMDADKQKTMFPPGSSAMMVYAKGLVGIVAKTISKMPNKIVITGHTDATPYSNAQDYGNWELSTDRANACRQVLEKNGVNKDRITSIVGKADTELFVKNDPNASQNRRFTVLLMREKA
ncbi:MAG: OmpA family protein [Alphaproteobacteria bacterium]|nr:OmpA family protein [Alphaproteobacteria bacterium]